MPILLTANQPSATASSQILRGPVQGIKMTLGLKYFVGENNSPWGCLRQNMSIGHFGRFPKLFVFLAKLQLKVDAPHRDIICILLTIRDHSLIMARKMTPYGNTVKK